MFQMQSEIFHAFRSSRQNAATPSAGLRAFPVSAGTGACYGIGVQEFESECNGPNAASVSRDIAISFLRLNLDNDIVDRLCRYEAALWRQLAQALFTLQALKRR